MKGNTAGRSAGQMALRAREKAARLEKYADAWDAGAAGERETERVLADLDPTVWRVMHDVRWPGRARANIDHIVVGPPGVFVVDTKNWSGEVVVRAGKLRQNGRSRERYVVGVADAAAAVRQLVPGTPVHPVICLVRDEPAAGSVRNVGLCSTANLRGLLASRMPVLGANDVLRVTATIEASVTRAEAVPPARHSAATPRKKRRAVKSVRSSRRRSGPSLRRMLVGFSVMGVLLASVQTGAYFDAFSRIGEVISSQVVDDNPPADDPATKPGRKQRQRNQQQEQDGGKRKG